MSRLFSHHLVEILMQLIRFAVLLLCVFALGSSVAIAQLPPITPKPVSVQAGEGTFTLTARTPVVVTGKDPAFVDVARLVTKEIGKWTGFALQAKKGTGKEKRALVFAVNTKDTALGREGYMLHVTKNGIRIEAAAPPGAFYGAQTLLQLLSASKPGSLKRVPIPAVTVRDAPRFTWRGMHLDVSRHFFPKEFVKTYIDMLAFHKMNVFHWHLTDDQGWRIEVKKYPRLTEVAAWRVDREDMDWNSRTPPLPGEKATYGGFYTQDDIKEVVAYAAARQITVVPEIEMPAHCLAVLAAYPQYSCTGGPFDVPPGSYWPNMQIYCAGNDSTFLFLQNVLDEVIPLFPGSYVHIGGDEADKTEWRRCAKCQARIKAENLKDEGELQSYFVKRMERYIVSKGRRLIGWDEILEGGLPPEATVMSWRGIAGGIAAARQRHDVVMTPTDNCYFDYYQGMPSSEPRAIGGYVPLSKVYAFDPVPDSLSPDETLHILGAQANLWTEFIPSGEHAQYMVLPRMAAMAEVVWTPRSARDWNDFAARVPALMQHYEVRGLRYARSGYQVSFGLAVDSVSRRGTFTLATELTPADIRYTVDGSEPSATSTLYTAPFTIDSSVTVRAASFRDTVRLAGITEQRLSLHQACFRPVTLKYPYERYTAGGAYGLTNGMRGTKSYGDGNWQGFHGVDLDAVVDLGSDQPLSRISVGFLQVLPSWIFYPTTVQCEVSPENGQYQPVGSLVVEQAVPGTPDAILEYSLPLTNVRARYVHLRAKSIGVCPDWHAGKGQPAWLFVDEIVVE